LNAESDLKVVSHVARDLLHSAAHFRSEAAVVWEYVVNSLQYLDEGVTPNVEVDIDSRQRQIRITDNGRGMTASDLRVFFTMHGENLDRKRGRPGRGKFGTGKSAAFGIANALRVETVRGGKRNVVELDRRLIESSDGSSIPIRWVVKDEVTDAPNGTVIVISEIVLERITTASVIEYIERHLQVFRARLPQVAVNDHVCSYQEPTVAERFEFRPTEEQKKVLGDIVMTVKVAAAPLPESEQGVTITAGPGNLVAIETGGIERKEMGNYLFGEVDVLALEAGSSTIEPYDPSRSLKLNLNHPVSLALVQFVGTHLDEVRRRQVAKLREAKRSEEARRLANLADKIAELLNEDFREVSARLQAIRAATARSGQARGQSAASTAGAEPDGFVEGLSAPGDVNGQPSEGDGNGNKRKRRNKPPSLAPPGSPNDDGNAAVDPAGGSGKKRNPRGGFSVDYRNLGPNDNRSRYDDNSLTILINLDHPVLKNALREGNIEDASFKRLSYEIAFSEYAIAFGYEKAKQDPDMPSDDLLFEVRSTLNRVSGRAAALYG
jgi:hypothetical protein